MVPVPCCRDVYSPAELLGGSRETFAIGAMECTRLDYELVRAHGCLVQHVQAVQQQGALLLQQQPPDKLPKAAAVPCTAVFTDTVQSAHVGAACLSCMRCQAQAPCFEGPVATNPLSAAVLHMQTNQQGMKLQCSHYFPLDARSADGKLPVVVYCHCNSGSRRDAEEAVYHLLPCGVGVVAFDFTVSGSQGVCWSLGLRPAAACSQWA